METGELKEFLRSFSCNEINNIHWYGRNGLSADGCVALFWTASGFAVETKAGELWAELKADWNNAEPWVSVWIDGAQVSRFIVEKGKRWYCLFRGLPTNTVHRFTLLKETQAMSDDTKHKLLVFSLGVPSSTQGTVDDIFVIPKRHKLKIEFIGDSLTSGEGLAGAPCEMDWISGWIALKGNYALLTAKRLNADFRLLSQCGWGVVASYDNNKKHVMPAYYEQTCGLINGLENDAFGANKKWDFKLWQPDVIVVNLGSNDWTAFNTPASVDPATGQEWKLRLEPDGSPNKCDVEFVCSGVSNFLEKLRSNNPDAYIIWCYGMISFDLGSDIQQAVEEYAKKYNDERVFFFRLPSMLDEKEGEQGSREHPGLQTHKNASDSLCACILDIM